MLANCLADDLPAEEAGQPRPLRRPHCHQCGMALPVSRWSALGAWLTGRGRCSNCAAARGARAVWVEAGAALGGAALWLWAGGDLGRWAAAGVVAFIFLVITIIDIEHRLILWRVVWVSGVVLLALGGLSPDRGWSKTLIGGVVGYVLVALLFLLGQAYAWGVARLRGQPLDEIAFGGGDVNLAGLIGLAVGWSGVLVALLLGVLAAGVFSLGYIVFLVARRRYNPHIPIPYGPFLIAGALAIYLYGRELAGWWLAGR